MAIIKNLMANCCAQIVIIHFSYFFSELIDKVLMTFVDTATLRDAYSFITHNHRIIKNTFKIATILTNAHLMMPTIFFFSHAMLFTFTLIFIIIPFFI